MNLIGPATFILLFAILSVPLATRFHLPLEIFLLIGSGILGYSSLVPTFQFDPQIIFNLFLPPILFYAAYFTSWRDFKFNFRPISLLAFGLVVFTTIIIALIAKLIIPNFTWAEGFLLGAIVSPTDATSATSIIKKLGAPRRLITIIEGESMVNDATALILFRFSLAAILGGHFSLPYAAINFLLMASGGALLGLVFGIVTIYLLPKIHSVAAETTFTIIVAFVCFLVGGRLGISGIIATVVSGIYCGIHFPQIASSSTRMNAKASWNTLLFIINGFAFTLIGLELPLILKNLEMNFLHESIVYGLIISITVMLVRLIWAYPMAYLPRLFFPSIARKDPMPSWKIIFVVGWSGMRGIVSLAAALSIPYFLATGALFPHRNLILFITYCVIIITLLIPAFSLPIILYFFQLSDAENEMKQEAMARIRSLENSINSIQWFIQNEKNHNEVTTDFLTHLRRRLDIIKTQLQESAFSTLNEEYFILRKLMIMAVQSERHTLLELRKSGDIHEEVFHRLSDELDLEEIRTNTLRI